MARERYDQPVSITKLKLEANKKDIGIAFKKDAKAVCDALEALDEHMLVKVQKCVEVDKCYEVELEEGRRVKVPSDMFTIQKVTEVSHVREYIPSVIEPSFGIGRIMYSLLEHVFWTRPEDEQRCVLSFPPLVAPTKCLVAPIMNQDIFTDAVESIAATLRRKEISVQVDQSSTTLGKKYARNDEIGIPFSVTVDHRTLEDKTVTIRDRDSTRQIRVAMAQVPDLMRSLVLEDATWADAMAQYEQVTVASD